MLSFVYKVTIVEQYSNIVQNQFYFKSRMHRMEVAFENVYIADLNTIQLHFHDRPELSQN